MYIFLYYVFIINYNSNTYFDLVYLMIFELKPIIINTKNNYNTPGYVFLIMYYLCVIFTFIYMIIASYNYN